MHHCFPHVKLSDVEKDRLVERLEAQIHDFCLDNSSRSTDATDFDVNRHIVLRNFLERNHYDVDKTIDFCRTVDVWHKYWGRHWEIKKQNCNIDVINSVKILNR